jgi:hypothetical protein
MGNSSSTSSVDNTSNQLYINKTTVDVINKSSNDAVANALIKNNASCSTVNDITQQISFHGCKVGNDINLTGIKQEASITVDFSCVNAFKAEQEMAQSLLSELVGDIQSKMDAKSINVMNTKAETQAKTSGINPFGGSSSADSNVKNTYNLSVLNQSNTAIQNVIANSIQSNFEVESIQNCIGQNAINQKQDYSYCEAGHNLNVSELEQKAGISAVVDCVNKSGTVNAVINAAGSSLGLSVVDDTKVQSTSTMTTELKTIAETAGLGGCISCCGDTGSSVSCSVIYVCCILLCMIVAYIYFQHKIGGKKLGR